jgi:ABC-type bacteriocin/lantibiotic exporter with double-glycine peptidase domain
MFTGEMLRRITVLILASAALVPNGGCFSPFYRSVDEQRLRLTGDYDLVPGLVVPAARGPDGCGAQALASVMAFHDPALDPVALADELPWHDVGATPVDLLLAARDRGFDARVVSGSWEAIIANVRRRRPPIVMVDASPEVRTLFHLSTPKLMHWSVVAGMAADGSRVLLGARNREYHVAQRDDFLKRWHKSANCLILVTKPEAEGRSPGVHRLRAVP